MVEGLSGWLALREPIDHASRSRRLVQSLAGRLRGASPLRAVDLASGTGSNIRFLSPLLPQPQAWLAIDQDPDLLRRVPPTAETRCSELGALDGTIVADRDLVTASALLDLVSDAWIVTLAGECRAAAAAVLFALTYDGRSTCSPTDADDDLVLRLFNEHQRQSDKGFGRAAGPDAVHRAARAFADAGYHVEVEASDWHVSPGARELQRMLIAGWAQAASEMAPGRSAQISQWLQRRLQNVEYGRSHVAVGHQDLAAWVR